jgi:hypothetical protein
MSLRIASTLLCLISIGRPVYGAPDPALPASWYGTWSGRLTVHAPDGKSLTRTLELYVAPAKDSKSFTWRMVSEFNNKKQVRNYELVPDPAKPGMFKIDEKNGILLNVRLMGGGLYSYYKDGDILITSRFERRGDILAVEMASIETKNPLVSQIKEENIVIQAYQLGSVQVGELKRKE